MCDNVTTEVAKRYIDLFMKNSHLYGGHLRRMKFDDYILPLAP